MKPTNKAPESTRKIDAGQKLQRRNPASEPHRTRATTIINGRVCVTDKTKITSDANSAAPDAKPSMPSMRLNAFAIPTSHKTVTRYETIDGRCTEPTKGTDKASTRPPIQKNRLAIVP